MFDEMFDEKLIFKRPPISFSSVFQWGGYSEQTTVTQAGGGLLRRAEPGEREGAGWRRWIDGDFSHRHINLPQIWNPGERSNAQTRRGFHGYSSFYLWALFRIPLSWQSPSCSGFLAPSSLVFSCSCFRSLALSICQLDIHVLTKC